MYMVQQRVTTAVREGYGDASIAELERELAQARAARAWMAGMRLPADVRASLDEPIAAIEEALAERARLKRITV